MFLKTRSKILRHLIVGLLAIAITYLFWLSRPQWSGEMRFWKAVGDGAYALLFLTLLIGPLAKIFSKASILVSWRRETGIWFALLAFYHGFLIASGWVMWSVSRFLGYEFVPQLERQVRLEPGFGLANLLGLTALFWAGVLAITSSDTAMRFLGPGWKWLHSGAYVIFYLVSLHILYFLFINYTLSFHKNVPPPDWFRYPFLLMTATIIFLQTFAFIKTVKAQKEMSHKKK